MLIGDFSVFAVRTLSLQSVSFGIFLVWLSLSRQRT